MKNELINELMTAREQLVELENHFLEEQRAYVDLTEAKLENIPPVGNFGFSIRRKNSKKKLAALEADYLEKKRICDDLADRLVDVVFALPQNYRCSLAVELIINYLNSGAQTLGDAVAMVEKWEQQYINDQQFEYMQNQQNEMLREIDSLNREVNYLACENSTLRSMYRF